MTFLQPSTQSYRSDPDSQLIEISWEPRPTSQHRIGSQSIQWEPTNIATPHLVTGSHSLLDDATAPGNDESPQSGHTTNVPAERSLSPQRASPENMNRIGISTSTFANTQSPTSPSELLHLQTPTLGPSTANAVQAPRSSGSSSPRPALICQLAENQEGEIPVFTGVYEGEDGFLFDMPF